MRSFRHWTPRYIKDRLASNYYLRAHPDRPWLTPAAIEILMSTLRTTDVGLEFGSGKSTLWFAKRSQHLSSVEHNQEWYQKVDQMLREDNIRNVDYNFVPKDAEGVAGDQAAYVRQADRFEFDSLNFVLVDGIYREHCVLKVLERIRPGGILVIDNVNRYLPSDTLSPNSRTLQAGPRGETWSQVQAALEPWRCIWTSSGVWDTAVYFRPCGGLSGNN